MKRLVCLLALAVTLVATSQSDAFVRVGFGFRGRGLGFRGIYGNGFVGGVRFDRFAFNRGFHGGFGFRDFDRFDRRFAFRGYNAFAFRRYLPPVQVIVERPTYAFNGGFSGGAGYYGDGGGSCGGGTNLLAMRGTYVPQGGGVVSEEIVVTEADGRQTRTFRQFR